MIIVQSLWLWFLFLMIGEVSSQGVDLECHKLKHEYDGVVAPGRQACIIVPPSGKHVHIEITKKSNGTLHVDGRVCDTESTKDVIYDVEYVDIDFHLSYLPASEYCPSDNVGVMRMMFKSDSGTVEFSVKMIEKYENERIGTSKGPTTGKQNNDKNAKFHMKMGIVLISVFGVGFIALTILFGFRKFMDYKMEKCRRAMEMEPIQLQNIERAAEFEPSSLNDDGTKTSKNLDQSDQAEDSNIELGSHLP